MDEEYVEMCRKAIEIQKDKLIWTGDYFTLKDRKLHAFGYKFEEIEIVDKFTGKLFNYQSNIWDKTLCIWLPRQDQLQEMLGIEKGSTFRGLSLLNTFIDKNAVYSMSNWSMEQLWLAFVMSELYQKHWHGNDWIKG